MDKCTVECVPVATTDRHHRVIDVFCQNCGRQMTKEDHKKYFESGKWMKRMDWIDFALLDYDNPGDPNDVDKMYST